MKRSHAFDRYRPSAVAAVPLSRLPVHRPNWGLTPDWAYQSHPSGIQQSFFQRGTTLYGRIAESGMPGGTTVEGIIGH